MRHGNEVLVVLLPETDALLPELIASDYDGTDMVRLKPQDQVRGRLMKDVFHEEAMLPADEVQVMGRSVHAGVSAGDDGDSLRLLLREEPVLGKDCPALVHGGIAVCARDGCEVFRSKVDSGEVLSRRHGSRVRGKDGEGEDVSSAVRDEGYQIQYSYSKKWLCKFTG